MGICAAARVSSTVQLRLTPTVQHHDALMQLCHVPCRLALCVRRPHAAAVVGVLAVHSTMVRAGLGPECPILCTRRQMAANERQASGSLCGRRR